MLYRILRARPRLIAAVAVGLLLWLLLPGGPRGLTRTLLAWDGGCATFLLLCAQHFTMQPQSRMALDAERQEEGEWTIFWITIGAALASFAAIIGEFAAIKNAPGAVRGLHVALVAATLLLSWLTTHTLFALRYAHEYYERTPDGSGFARGLQFPDEPAPDYWDFLYFALVLGMTFQVSDVQITRRPLRRLATVHGLLGFLFNTVLFAITVNLAANLVQ
jgi:uncharacterized membrane protein